MQHLLRLSALFVLTAAALSAPSRASAYTFRRAADGQPVRWRAERVELRVDPALTGGREGAHAAVAMGADAWRDLWNAPLLHVAGDTEGLPGHHAVGQENGVYLVEGAWPYGRALAVTVTTAIESTGEIVDTDILVSSRPDVRMAERGGDHGYDLVAVLAHEIGHVLGLGESEVLGATMYPTLSPGDVGPRTIENDDEQGVLAAYEGARVASTGCTAAPGSRGATSGLVLALGIGLLVVSRRRAAPVLALGLVVLIVGFDPPAATRPLAVDPAAHHALFEIAPVIGEVDSIEVIDREGIFVTRCVIATPTGERVLEVPGGTQDGLVQIVGESLPPVRGDALVLGAHDAWAFVSRTHAWGGSLEHAAPVPLPEHLRAR